MRKLLASIFAMSLLLGAGPALAEDATALLNQAQQGDHRGDKNRARDTARHPVETLQFFGWQPDMTVVEVSPGTGWYTEILAPITRPKGVLYGAGFALTADDLPSYGTMVQKMLVSKLEEIPAIYDHVVVTELSVPQRVTPAPPGSADMVLTFRNLHNWVKADEAAEMLAIFYRTLKPGGVLGVVDHRAKPGTSVEDMARSGYVTEEYAVELAKAAGFEFEASSTVNNNAADNRDHPMGVWSLPPSLRGCKKIESANEKAACEKPFRAIGESDRMTLRFRKPV